MSITQSDMEFSKFSVRDGVRTRPFEGIKLAESSSRVHGRPRWVEFALYVTPKGQYVVSRIGYSVFYHAKSCHTVVRNNLSAVDGLELAGEYIPCSTCRPTRTEEDGVFPETPRFAAWVCPDAGSVVSSLMQEDDNRIEYLTNVARRLLLDASTLDSDIEYAFNVDPIE